MWVWTHLEGDPGVETSVRFWGGATCTSPRIWVPGQPDGGPSRSSPARRSSVWDVLMCLGNETAPALGYIHDIPRGGLPFYIMYKEAFRHRAHA